MYICRHTQFGILSYLSELILNMMLYNLLFYITLWNEYISMHMCKTSQLKKQTWKMGQNPKSNKLLVTRKLPKTKFHWMIKSKIKVKDTSENANRKKAGARF